jgi:ATP-dependent Clp protease adaptor protein ClpS
MNEEYLLSLSSLHANYDNPETDVLTELETEVTDVYKLTIYNDDINTFDHVINALIQVCGHTPEQAEQCTIIIHYKGKCLVKEGEYDEMASMCTAITDRGISAVVEI